MSAWTIILDLDLDDREVEPLRLTLAEHVTERTGKRPATRTITTLAFRQAITMPLAPRGDMPTGGPKGRETNRHSAREGGRTVETLGDIGSPPPPSAVSPPELKNAEKFDA